MRTPVLTVATVIVYGLLVLHAGLPTVLNLVASAATVQEAPPQPQSPQINVEINRGSGRAWYMSPVWMAIGGLALVVLILIVAMAARGGGGGTTIVRG